MQFVQVCEHSFQISPRLFAIGMMLRMPCMSASLLALVNCASQLRWVNWLTAWRAIGSIGYTAKGRAAKGRAAKESSADEPHVRRPPAVDARGFTARLFAWSFVMRRYKHGAQ